MLHIQIISGPRKGEAISLEQAQLPLTIGRDSENKLCIESAAISRFHAEIFTDEGNYFLRDLQSTNGTFLNGRKIEREKLGPGDEFSVANINMSVEAAQSAMHEPDSPLRMPVSIDKPVSLEATLHVTRPTNESVVVERLKSSTHYDLSNSLGALQSLYRADAIFHDIEDLNKLMESVISLLLEVIPSSRGYIFLLGEDTGTPLLHVRRAPTPFDKNSQIIINEAILNTAIARRESILAHTALISERPDTGSEQFDSAVISAICAPMTSRDTVLGFIYLDTWEPSNTYSSGDLTLLAAMTSKVATMVENGRLYQNLRNLFYNTIETLIRTMQAKDKYTSGHSTRVSRFSLLIAEKLGLNSKEKHQLYLASVLHDIGKIGLPDKLLLRPGKLTEEEMELVKKHPAFGVSMIKSLGEMQEIVPLILHHHEALDGSGYPDGLKGEEIPLMSRIVAVADTYDAITSDRPYRKGRSREEAVQELKRVAGTKLDPRVVNAFLEVLREISPEQRSTEPQYST
jgi:pSer/pThr/pTyr-binding forkhead associated (FHA) protein